MDQFASFMNSSPINFNSVFAFNDLSKDVRTHLARTYSALAATVLAAAVGAYVDMYIFHFGNLLTGLGCLGLSMAITMTPSEKANMQKRMLMLLAAGFLNGASLGPLIGLSLYVNPSTVITALLGTLMIFLCFSGAALFAQRRSYLYLGGILGTAISWLAMGSLANIFFRSQIFFTLELYVGLLVFCGYVIFDTQLIVEKASYGSRDYVGHALGLFMDLVSIFVRILIILNKKAEEEERRKEKRRR